MSDEKHPLHIRIAELERELAVLHKVLDLMPTYLYVIDEEGRYRMANKAALDALGQSRDSILKVKFHEVAADPAQGAQLLELARETMRAGDPKISPRVDFQPHNGPPQVLQLHEVPFVDEASGRRWLLGISMDLTAEVQLEQVRIAQARVEQELEIAREIQQSLFPKEPPAVPGFDVAGWSRPAEETGGDFYDWFEAPHGTTYAMIGDVTGHGVGPAIIAATTRAYIRATFTEPLPLHELIGRLNDQLVGELPGGMFVTLAVAALSRDPSDPIETIAAGQGPIFGRDGTNGKAEEIHAHGPPLGVLRGTGYREADRCEVDPDSLLVLLSDGFFEHRNRDGAMFGHEHVVERVTAHRGSAAALIEDLRAAVADFADGATQDDDMTAVIVRTSARA
ncbi:MAG: SpoIIE family protein phosphatase [Planctomycetota bacterium]